MSQHNLNDIFRVFSTMLSIFIFCTTEPNKVPATIMNRVQRFNITKINNNEIKAKLEYICKQEGFTNYTDTCELISKLSNGGMREAITKLDQCADLSHDLCLDTHSLEFLLR